MSARRTRSLPSTLRFLQAGRPRGELEGRAGFGGGEEGAVPDQDMGRAQEWEYRLGGIAQRGTGGKASGSQLGPLLAISVE